MYGTFYIIDLKLLFSLSWFVILPDCLSSYDYGLFCTLYTCCHVCHLYLWSGLCPLCMFIILSCCSLLSAVDEFIELRL